LDSDQPQPGTIRPRGRTERVRQSVTAATRALLTEGGYDSLTVERVAEAAGVAKSTVYRRWGDTAGLLMEVLRELVATEIPLVDTGSVDSDLRELAIEISRFFSDHQAGPVVMALISDAVHNPRASDEMRGLWAERNDRAAEAVRRGIDRGELPAATDPVEVIRALGAPIYYRLLVTHETVDDAVAERAAAAALAAARAGTFNLLPSRAEAAPATAG
jgi:AcrR family transcriptional regulator